MSLANLGQSLLRQIGINVHRWPSQRHLVFEYPVADEPRYGLKTGPYLPMLDLLEAKREQMSATLVEIAKQVTLLQGIPANSNGNSLAPYWNNGWFPPLDACVFMHFLLKYRPRRYVEIGSGNSTIFAHYAKCFGNLETTITSIDPQPRAGIDMLCDNIFREGLQSADLSLFDELQPGDIIFFDGSHVVFQDSDVTVFFLEVLPRIKAGVIVHVHDIFWPRDYPKNWGTRYYSEQYMLAMLFLYAPERFEILFGSAYASDIFQKEVSCLTPGGPVYGVYGTSYWFEVR